MAFIQNLVGKLQRHPKRFVFAEGSDPRILQAARQVVTHRMGVPVLLGERGHVKGVAQRLDISLDGMRMVDPAQSEELEAFAASYASMRAHKGVTIEQARKAMESPSYFATMMMSAGQVDALVSGATASASSALRPLFEIIPRQPGVQTASSMLIIDMEARNVGIDGVLFMADCGVLAEPSAGQLADIAVTTATLAHHLTDALPRVAMLSFSTNHSSNHPSLARIRTATALARESAARLQVPMEIEGEIQVDAALRQHRLETGPDPGRGQRLRPDHHRVEQAGGRDQSRSQRPRHPWRRRHHRLPGHRSPVARQRAMITAEPKPDKLLVEPVNRVTKRLFVAATRMNDGKTTTCLGLFEALHAHFSRIGFIKPIGQRYVQVDGHLVDEDSFLFDQIFHVQVPIESMSPVTIDSTFTRRYLENPDKHRDMIADRICRAFDRVSWEKDFTIIEGTGHAGVGSVFDHSNARVARLLDAKAIIVSQGGIGRPVDEIALNKALFDQEGVEVIGAVLNKVEPEKTHVVADYAGRGLMKLGVPLLGVLPVQKMLSAPNLAQVVEEVSGRWINGSPQAGGERILRVVIGAMTAKGIIDYLLPGALIITPGDRDDIILAAVASSGAFGQKGLSGIILTRDILPHPKILELLAQTTIPVIVAGDDSYSIASKINNMTVKTQPQDRDKIPVIKRLIQENVDLDRLLAAF